MENISQEQFLALGALGFAILGIAILVTFAVMAGTLKLSISWLGNASPSFVACFGWLLAITFVNCFIVLGTMSLFGQRATMLATPLTWFATAYMISNAANCGLARAFGIWIVNSFLSTIGLVAIVLVVTIPIAMIGAGAQADDENLQAEFGEAEFVEVDQMMAELDSQMEAFDNLEIPEATNVGFQTGGQTEVERGQDDSSVRFESADDGLAAGQDETPRAAAPQSSPKSAESGNRPAPKVQPKTRTGSRKKAPRRAADGSTINPFFQD